MLPDIFPIKSGVPQGRIIGPVLFTLFIAGTPTSSHTTPATLADDRAILSSNENPAVASINLQNSN